MKESIQQKVKELQRLSSSLFYPSEEDEVYYVDQWQSTHSRISFYLQELFPLKGNTAREEAELCLALLMGYNAAIGRRPEDVQRVLKRARHILPILDSSLLKCNLLTFCYAEVYDDTLAQEAHSIIDTWKSRPLQAEEQHIIETLTALEEIECLAEKNRNN